MVKILVLYYSTTGNTETLAKAIAEGAKPIAEVTTRRVDYATIYDLITCDGVAFGSPNYFGYMAGLVKDYFDKAWSVRAQITGKVAVAFTSGGGSSNSALLSLENMFNAFKLEKAADGIVSSRRQTEQDLDKCKALGKALAEAAVRKTKTRPRE